ncbi:MAG TPA: rod shape-determining protein MreC [Candidatus Paceibacterota bacterium]
MNYRLRDNRKKSNSKILLRVFGVALLLWLVSLALGGPLRSGVAALQRAVGHAFGYYNEPVRPISENALIQSLRSENEELKMLLGRVAEPDDKILATVLVRPPKTPYDSLVIDIGENQGLLAGDFVYGEMNYLIGRIEEVRPVTSVVKLFSTPGERIDALLGTGSTTSAVSVEGRGGGNFYIKIPRNVQANEGDPIVVPGTNSYVLGAAETVDAGEGDAYAHIYFRLPVKLNSIQYVQVQKAVR